MVEAVDVLLRARMEASDVTSGVGQIQKSLQGLTLPKGLTNDLEKELNKLGPLLKDYQKQLSKGFSNKKDLQNFSALKTQIGDTLGIINNLISQANSKEIKLKVDTQAITKSEKDITTTTASLQKALAGVFNNKVNADNIASQFDKILQASTKAPSLKGMFGKAQDLFNKQDYAAYNTALDQIKNKILSLKTTKVNVGEALGVKDAASNLDKVKDKIESVFNGLKVNESKIQTIELLKNELKQLGINAEQLDLASKIRGEEEFQNIIASLGQMENGFRETGNAAQDAASGIVSMKDQVGQLQQSTQYFFSLRNMINLFKRGVDEAIDTVKQLDAVMTETAVVTNFNVGDMWEKLPEYTSNANALGASVKDMYEATTLYYQQGLNTEQAMSIASETMKMARIGGLEAADATDKMTAALRGFNMELNETSAQRVNDVYSNLAAKTASNTEELGTAMQRTASIAASAGMSFEGTSAFLAQAIETTREPAENLGTAMKTIVARFTELKKNPLEIVDVDGEEVSYNKVDTALQSIGVSLKDANGQFRALDEVFLDISQRWDSLTQTQQRYIATTAAGSRQQSRFIAMMSNYERTMQLMDYANNSAGASSEQFGKTMESLEAKLNRLRNAWDRFLMGIANSNIIKGAVDKLTSGLDLLNDAINKLSRGSGGLKSILSLATAFMGLKGIGRAANTIIGGLGGLVDPQSSLMEGLKGGFLGKGGLFGGKQLQAERIYSPIVKAIYDLIPHIDGKKGATDGGDIGPGDHRQARKDLNKQIKDGQYSVQGLSDIIAKNSLNKQQQKDFFQSVPGLKQNLVGSLAKLYEKVGMDPKTSKGLIKGFKKGDLSLDEVLNQDGLQTSFAQRRAELAEKEGAEAARKFAKQYGDSLRQEGLSQGLKGKELQNFIQNGKVPTEELSNFNQEMQNLTPVQKFANTTAKAGAALTSLGSSLQMLGSSISQTNPLLGRLASSMGQVVSMAGSLALAIPQIIAGGPVAWVATAAAVAIGGMVGVLKYQSDKAKEQAKKVLEDYNNAVEKSTEKISTLNSARDTFAELAKGVDRYNNNISLGESDYADYLETSQRIAELAPELIRGYDAQGRAIIATGSALDDLITKEELYQKEAIKKFADDASIDALIGGIRESDAYKKYGREESGYQQGIATNVSKPFEDQIAKVRSALQSAGVDFAQISQQLFGREINLINPSSDDLRLLSQHYRDIINLAESQNRELTEKQKTGMQNAFSGLSEGWNSVTEEMQPLTQAIGQYLSLEGMDAIGLELGTEFTESFNKGLESLIITDVLDEKKTTSEIKADALAYAEGFKQMTQEGSEYAKIMKQVTAEQEKYVDTIDDPGAVDNYKNAVEGYVVQLEELANRYDDGTEKGKLFANTLRETANSIRNYATETTADLATALNTLSDEFTSARGAQERFNSAIEGGDYYTAAEGYKSIIDTVLDEKNRLGDGSLTGWAGAEELLGQNFVDNNNWSTIVSQIEKIQGCFADGADGVIAFNDLLTENADKLKGLGEVGENGFEFNLQNEDLEEYAKVLNMSEDALAALIDKARQWVPIDLSDPGKVRAALEQSSYSMAGTSSKGENLLYTSEAQFRQEARKQGIRGDDYTKTVNDAMEKGVRFLSVENLTTKNGKDGLYADTVFKNLGLTGVDKNLNNAVSVLTKMGFSLEEQQNILTAKGLKLSEGEVSKEDVQAAYQEQEYAMENPTVAGIANDTGVIANAANAILASMGILTKQTKEDIDSSTSKERVEELTGNLNEKHTDSASRNAAVKAIDDQITNYNDTLQLLEKGGITEGEYVNKLTEARGQLIEAKNNEQKAWDKQVSEAYKSLEGIGTAEEQSFLQDKSVDIARIVNEDDLLGAATALKQLGDEGNLSHASMAQLAADFLQFRQGDLLNLDSTQLDQLCTKLGLTATEGKQLLDILQVPFALEGRYEGEDLTNYINNFEGLTDTEKSILLSAETTGEEKVTALIDEINSEFGDGSEKKKTILLEAEAKMAGGDQEGAKKILADAGFSESQVQEIVQKLSITVNGTVANKDEVQSSLNSQLEGMNLTAEAKAKVSAKLDIGKQQQSATVNYKTGSQEKAKDQNAGVNYNKVIGQKEPSDKNAGVNYTWKSQDSPKDKTAWVTYKERARGQNYSMPAHRSISFGSAADGLNLSKKKKSTGSVMTALVGEEGFEVGYIPSEQRSVIFGANGPEMTSFPSDTVIYPHKQSKEIVRRGKGGHATLGSFGGGKDTVRSGGLLSLINSSSGNSSSSNKSSNNSGKSVEKAAKAVEDTAKQIGGVSVWWENIARKTEATQRKADKNQKAFEKYIKSMKATLTTTGTEGKGNSYIQNLNKVIDYNNQQLDRAIGELGVLDSGTSAYRKAKTAKAKKAANKKAFNQAIPGVTQISYSTGKKKGKSKNELVNLAPYIKAQDGTYVVDQAAINKIKNKEKRKAVADAANKEINDLISKKNKAEDEIQKAQEALQKMAEELYKTFFAWETELTKIWNITQKIEQAEARLSRQKAYGELLTSQLNSGLAKATDEFNKESLATFKSELKQEADVLRQRADSISTLQKNVQKAISTADEQETLNAVNAKLNSNKNVENAISNVNSKQSALNKAKTRQSNAEKAVSAAKKELKAAQKQQKKAKKTSSKKDDKKANAAVKKAQDKLNAANKELKNAKSAVSTAQSAFNKANEAYKTTIKNNTALSDTEKMGYEQYAKELQEQIEVQKAAQKYTKITQNADGTVSIDFNTDQLEADKLAGLLTGDKVKKIEEYVKNIQEATKDLNDAYKEVNEGLTAMYDKLATLEDQWAGYAKELWDYSEKKSKEDVDNFKKLSTSITNALKKLLDEVKRKLDDRRRTEDNAKTEAEISKKQQRLAALQADTSGGHQVEIAQLQQEITSAQQDYQRSLEDQLLDKLQQQADLAAEQRERLIELAEAQLEVTNNAALVDMWMADPAAFEEDIYEAYKAANDYDKSPQAIQEQIDRNFETFWNGLVNNQDEQEAVENEIQNLTKVVNDIKEYLRLSALNITNAKETFGLSAAEAQSQTNSSWADVKERGGYSAQDFADAGVSYENARQAFSTSELKPVEAYAEQATQEEAKLAAQAQPAATTITPAPATNTNDKQKKLDTYNNAIRAVKKKKPANVKPADVNNLFTKGSAAGRGKARVLLDLVGSYGGSDPFTWKNIFRAIIDASGINRYNLVKTFGSNGTLPNAVKTLKSNPNTISEIKKHKSYKSASVLKYKTGGIADFTGPAWLDGTPSRPELVLNATDTKNFIALKDVLSKAMSSTSAVGATGGNTMYEININVDHINSDYDVDRLAERIKKDIVKDSGYRNVTQVRKFR